jgi:hypothetical protein
MLNWTAWIAASAVVAGNGMAVYGSQDSVTASGVVTVTVTAGDEQAPQTVAKDGEAGSGSNATAGDKQPKTGTDRKEIEIRVQSRRESGDGQDAPKITTRGKIVVIGPDGVRKEYDLNDTEGRAVILQMDGGKDTLAELENLSAQASGLAQAEEKPAVEERMVIGVVCEAADPLLRRHLKLDNAGLVVVSVSEAMPASETGVEVDDILLSVNEKKLTTREELVEIVSASEGMPLQLNVLRDGEPKTMTVTPRKMAVPAERMTELLPNLMVDEELRKLMENGDLQFGKLVHPGVIVEGEVPSSPEGLQKMLQKLRIQAREVMPLREQQSLADQLEEVRAEMKKLREELQNLKQNKP